MRSSRKFVAHTHAGNLPHSQKEGERHQLVVPTAAVDPVICGIFWAGVTQLLEKVRQPVCASVEKESLGGQP